VSTGFFCVVIDSSSRIKSVKQYLWWFVAIFQHSTHMNPPSAPPQTCFFSSRAVSGDYVEPLIGPSQLKSP